MEERILVCLSSSPSNGKIIRTAAQMAEAFNGTLTALFVETPLAGKMGKEDQERLKENIKLAKQSGAEIKQFTVMIFLFRSRSLPDFQGSPGS